MAVWVVTGTVPAWHGAHSRLSETHSSTTYACAASPSWSSGGAQRTVMLVCDVSMTWRSLTGPGGPGGAPWDVRHGTSSGKPPRLVPLTRQPANRPLTLLPGFLQPRIILDGFSVSRTPRTRPVHRFILRSELRASPAFHGGSGAAFPRLCASQRGFRQVFSGKGILPELGAFGSVTQDRSLSCRTAGLFDKRLRGLHDKRLWVQTCSRGCHSRNGMGTSLPCCSRDQAPGSATLDRAILKGESRLGLLARAQR